MRALVGTLRTFENEFEACADAIARQRGIEIEHFVVRDLPNREAHDELYRTFMDRSKDFDLLVKVDADMVIASETLIAELARRFAEDEAVDQAEIPVLDFFTDRLVPGLNAFRATVRWPARPDGLFVDETPVPSSRRAKTWHDLAPAARHCPDPSPFQAFHFGLHKGLKVREARAAGQRERLARHWENVELTWRRFRCCGDLRLLLACAGAELALARVAGPAQVDHDDPWARTLFERARVLSPARLAREVRRLRRRRLLGIPPALWLRWWSRPPYTLRGLLRRARSALR